MGLDSVEIVMAVEERFGITIADKEAEIILTPGQLVEMVYAKVRQSDFSQCSSRRGFYVLRRALMKMTGVSRKEVRPDVNLGELLPAKKRGEQWRELRSALGAVRWPPLVPQPGLSVSILVISLTVAFLIGYRLRSPIWAAVGLVITIAFGLWATRPIHNAFPAKCSTVGQLADNLTGLAPKLFEPTGPTWTRDEVRAAIRVILVGILDCEKTYREDARFIEDLGMD